MGRTSKLKRTPELKHRFLRHWREEAILPKGVLVAFSGGVDSVVLLDLLWEWRRLLGFELALAHVHHGRGGPAQTAYRRKASEFSARAAAKFEIPLLCNCEFDSRGRMLKAVAPKAPLKSEAELRDFRRQSILGWRSRWGDGQGFI